MTLRDSHSPHLDWARRKPFKAYRTSHNVHRGPRTIESLTYTNLVLPQPQKLYGLTSRYAAVLLDDDETPRSVQGQG